MTVAFAVALLLSAWGLGYVFGHTLKSVYSAIDAI